MKVWKSEGCCLSRTALSLAASCQAPFAALWRAVWCPLVKLDLATGISRTSPNNTFTTPTDAFAKSHEPNRYLHISNLPPNTQINMNRGGGGGGRKVLLPPINFIFKLLQQHSTVQIWLYEQLAIRIEGRIRVSDCCRVSTDIF